MKREDVTKVFENATKEQIDAILDLNSGDIGKAKKDFDTLKAENDTLKADKTSLETKITELSEKSQGAEDYKKQLDDLKAEIKTREDNEKAQKVDSELTAAIEGIFGDKKFTSDYVKNGIVADMKAEIAKAENKGKGYSEIFETLTKDKEGIFANPNPPATIPGLGNIDTSKITKEAFTKMGYAERTQLYSENPNLYNELKGE